MTLHNRGILDSRQNRMKEAQKEYEEALKIYQQFAQRNPEKFQLLVDEVLRDLKELPN